MCVVRVGVFAVGAICDRPRETTGLPYGLDQISEFVRCSIVGRGSRTAELSRARIIILFYIDFSRKIS